MSASDDRSPLPDGRYPVIVVDAEGDDPERADAHDGPTSISIDVIVTVGPSKGQVVTLRADLASFTVPSQSAGALSLTAVLLGLPGDLIVDGGRPRLELDEV